MRSANASASCTACATPQTRLSSASRTPKQVSCPVCERLCNNGRHITRDRAAARLHAVLLCPLPIVVHVKHRVRQAARLPHHRERAVAHANHLREAARLKHAGNQHHVAARVDQVAEGLVEGEGEARAVMVLVRELARQVVKVALHAHFTQFETAHGRILQLELVECSQSAHVKC